MKFFNLNDAFLLFSNEFLIHNLVNKIMYMNKKRNTSYKIAESISPYINTISNFYGNNSQIFKSLMAHLY